MADSKAWSPIYFACHDPPVILLYSTSFDRFLVEFLKRSTPGFNTVIDSTGRDRVHYIWRKNPGVITYDQCLQSPDDELAAFARQLGPTFVFFDLRNAEIGSGFSWGRFGAGTVVRRNGTLPIFA